MYKKIISLLFLGLLIGQNAITQAEDTLQQESEPAQQSQTLKENISQSGVVTKVKGIFKNNEQKPKSMRSKDIVKAKEKIRQQELLKKQKENEIRYLERKMHEKQKTLERLEK